MITGNVNNKQDSNWQKMTRKQRAFVTKYLETRDLKEATRAAGYKGNLKVLGTRILNRKHVKAWLDAQENEKVLDAIMSRQEMSEILTEIIRSEATDFLNEHGELDLTCGNPKAIGEFILDEDVQTGKVVKHKIKIIDKLRSMERLSRLQAYDQLHPTEQAKVFAIKLPDNFPQLENEED